MTSKDLFSRQAATYSKFRPTYPAELFQYILSFVKNKDVAWDCATGNGQAAFELANYFDKVFASDISAEQIQHAKTHPKIKYEVSSSEKTEYNDNMFDLITVAQAYHWLHLEEFHREALRVGKSDSVIAIWGYDVPTSENQPLNQLIRMFYVDIVGPYWDPERRFIDDHYRTVPFPFEELPAKEFYKTIEWNYDDLCGYLNSWSSVQHFIKATNVNPVEELMGELQKVWGKQQPLTFNFPLFARIGRIAKQITRT